VTKNGAQRLCCGLDHSGGCFTILENAKKKKGGILPSMFFSQNKLYGSTSTFSIFIFAAGGAAGQTQMPKLAIPRRVQGQRRLWARRVAVVDVDIADTAVAWLLGVGHSNYVDVPLRPGLEFASFLC
jgi:hypothetical protein